MAEEIKEVKQEVKQEVSQEVKETKEPDLLTRVSQVKKEEKEEEGKFNINELDSHIEKIQDPALKEQFVGLKKSLLRGENQKYQEIASLRKQYETKLSEVTTWTPERMQQEMNRPDFVQAAQTILKGQNSNDSGLTDQQWSTLSESEKTELNQLKQKIVTLEKNSWEAVKSNQDVQLKQKYADYDPQEIDKLTDDLMRGKLQATREHLYKVLKYEESVKKAYELGLLDKNTQNREKMNGMSFDSGRNMATSDRVEKQKGETTQDFFQRSYQEHSKKK